jgi:hypothetical protein
MFLMSKAGGSLSSFGYAASLVVASCPGAGVATGAALSAGGRDASFTVGGGDILPVSAFLFGSDCACKVAAQNKLARRREVNFSIGEETPEHRRCPMMRWT